MILNHTAWQEADLAGCAAMAVPATLLHLGIAPEGHEVAVLGCDDAEVARLNSEFRGKAVPTNVLSWPAIEMKPGDAPLAELGDIAISYETCAREASGQGKPFRDHVTHLLVHATLHLLGYDHENDAEAAQMERLEVEILGKLGLPDPY